MIRYFIQQNSINNISVAVTSNLTDLLLRRHLPLRINWDHCWKRIEHWWRWDGLLNINGLNNMSLSWSWANIWIRKNVHRLLWLGLHDVEIDSQHNIKSLISLSLKLGYIPQLNSIFITSWVIGQYPIIKIDKAVLQLLPYMYNKDSILCRINHHLRILQ